MRQGDLVKYTNSQVANRWIPKDPEYFEVIAALQSTVGVIISEKIDHTGPQERVLVHWLDLNRATYENIRYLEVVS